MPLQTYTFSQIVSNIATTVQAKATALVNFSVGSVLRALAEAISGVTLWLQAIILKVLTLTRAATSVGTDLDSWMADYGFLRLGASASTGQVTLARFTPTQQAQVPIGTTIQTQDGTQKFTVTLDTGNSAYNSSLATYVLPINTTSVNVPVVCLNPGSGGNVLANTITVITTPVPGVDTVTNGADFTNGIDAESDPSYRSRFVLYIASLSRATKAAVAFAIDTVQQGLDFTLTENQSYSGAYQPGYFYVVVDDGTGSPSGTILTAVGTAIEAIRPVTVTFGVFAPITTTANVGLTLTTDPAYIHSTVIANVAEALTNFINGLAIGVSLPYTQISSIAYEITGVTNVTSITLNSSTSDLTADAKHKIIAGTMTIA